MLEDEIGDRDDTRARQQDEDREAEPSQGVAVGARAEEPEEHQHPANGRDDHGARVQRFAGQS